MASPQIPGQPPALPLVDKALGGGLGREPAHLDIALGTQQPEAPVTIPGQPTQTAAFAPQQPAPAPIVHGGRAWINVGGEMFSVPPEQVETALAQTPLSRLATTQEVQQRLLEKEQEGFIGGATAIGKAATEGLYTGVTALPRGLAALGYAATGSEALKDFVRETAPSNIFPTIAAASSGGLSSELTEQHAASDAEAQARAERDAERREWANLTMVAETAGLIAGSVATALAGGAVVGGAGKASQFAFGGGALRQGALGAAEGLAQGAAQPFNDGGTATQREVLIGSLVGGLIGGAVAGGGTAIANRLSDSPISRLFAKPSDAVDQLQSKVFGRPKIADDVADDIARRVDPDAPAGAGADAVLTREFYEGLNDEVRAKIAAAGPNPKAMREAAERAVAERDAKLAAAKKTAGRIDEDNWKGIAPQYRPILKDEILEGATRDLERTHNALMRDTDAIETFLKDAPAKAEKVRANLVASQVDDAAAMQSAYSTLEDFRGSFSKALMEKSREIPLKKGAGKAARDVRPLEPDPEFWGPYKGRIKSIEYTIKKADEAFGNAKDAADAYIVLDQVRREVAAQVNGLARSATSDNPLLADPARRLQQWAKDEYLGRLVDNLGDASIWGKQGAAQSSVNLAWRDKIAANYLGDITTVVQRDFGEAVRVADPAKARELLNGIDKGQRALRRDKLTAYYDAAEDMATAIKNNYDLTPAQLKAAEGAIERARAAREIMQTVDRQSSVLTERVVKGLMSHVTGAGAGIVAGGVAGGPLGSLIGAMVLPAVQEAAKSMVRRVAIATAKGAEKVGESGVRRVAKKLGDEYVQSISAKSFGVGAAGAGLARSLFDSTRNKDQRERYEIYEARKEALGQLASNPARAEESMSRVLGNMPSQRPTMAGLTSMEMMGKVRALRDEWPGTTELSPVAAKRQTTASIQDVKKSEALWEATVDPGSVFTDWQRGDLDYDKVEFSQKLYPEMWNLYRAAVMDQLSSLPADAQIDDNQLAQLDMLFGFNGSLSPDVSPAFSARVTEYAAELAQQNQPGPQRQLDLPTSRATFTQRIGGRRG